MLRLWSPFCFLPLQMAYTSCRVHFEVFLNNKSPKPSLFCLWLGYCFSPCLTSEFRTGFVCWNYSISPMILLAFPVCCLQCLQVWKQLCPPPEALVILSDHKFVLPLRTIWKGTRAGMQLAVHNEATTRLALFSKQSIVLVEAELLISTFFVPATLRLANDSSAIPANLTSELTLVMSCCLQIYKPSALLCRETPRRSLNNPIETTQLYFLLMDIQEKVL